MTSDVHNPWDDVFYRNNLKDCLARPYADSDTLPDFHDAADSDSSPNFHDIDSSPDFHDLNPIHHTIPSTIIQSSYLHPPVGRVYAIY